MFQLIKSILPKEEKFFDLFEAHAAKAEEAAATLRTILEGGEAVADNCLKLSRQEEEADHISYEVMQAIRRSFITRSTAATSRRCPLRSTTPSTR